MTAGRLPRRVPDSPAGAAILRRMQMTVEFTNVYDGDEHISRATVEVEDPPVDEDDLEDWAEENLYPHTGDGNAVDKDAGYFADIVACTERPDLVGKEFQWC